MKNEFIKSLQMIKILEIKNLSFKYPDSAKNVLKSLSLSIKQGEHIALIGGTGSGKTKVLLKVIDKLLEKNKSVIYF